MTNIKNLSSKRRDKMKRKLDIFSRIAHKYDKIVGPFDFDKVKNYLQLEKDSLLLDLGGGTGRVSIFLTNHVNECIVFDRSFEMLQQARFKSREFLLVQGLSELLPFKTNSLKQIFLNDALHHIKMQKETLKACYSVLSPKGKLIIREFDRKYFWNIFMLLFEKIMRFGSKFFTPDELAELCKESGFRVNWKKPSKSTFILTAEKAI